MKCSICKGNILTDDPAQRCDICQSVFHAECWNRNGGCGTPGCPNLPKSDKRDAEAYGEIAFWGISTKNCPACGEVIKVEEMTCPYCHEKFDTMAPITTRELKERIAGVPRGPKGRKAAIAVFICGLIGCTAPLNLLIGGIWYSQNRQELKQSSPTHNLLAVAGLIFSAFYVLLLIIGAMVSS